MCAMLRRDQGRRPAKQGEAQREGGFLLRCSERGHAQALPGAGESGLRGAGGVAGVGVVRGTCSIILSVSCWPGERSPLPMSGSSVRCRSGDGMALVVWRGVIQVRSPQPGRVQSRRRFANRGGFTHTAGGKACGQVGWSGGKLLIQLRNFVLIENKAVRGKNRVNPRGQTRAGSGRVACAGSGAYVAASSTATGATQARAG